MDRQHVDNADSYQRQRSPINDSITVYRKINHDIRKEAIARGIAKDAFPLPQGIDASLVTWMLSCCIHTHHHGFSGSIT
jgi:hypothetical protein